jgi:tetratricopeptide (TPR) repeat protein
LKIALNALQDGKNLPALNGLETAETLEVFPDIRECDKAITSHDKPKAMHLIDSFFKQYIGHVPNVFKSIEKQNLYCSILTLAREMTNTGWIKESDAVLNRLDKAAEGKDANGLTRGYLRAELAYNASKAKRDASPEWSELESSWHVFPVSQAASKDDAEENDDNATVGRGPVKDIAFSTRLRILALIYYYAGELERAQLYIDQALIAHDSELGQPSEKFVHGNNDSGTQKILMLLDMACIVAKSKQFDKAESLWTQLQTLEVVKGDAYPHTVVELCSIYVDSNRSARAIEILKQTRARSRGLSSHQLDNGYTAMDFMLAKLLKGAGKIKEAKLLVDEAAAEMPKRLGWLDCLLVAQCAEAEGDFAQAGKYYALEPWTSSPSEFVTYSSDKYTEKALECAVKAPTYDKIELSKLYVRVAEIRTNREKRDASELYQKAIDLLPDSDPQKSSLMTRLANSKFYSSSSSSKQPPQKGMSSTQPTDSVGKTLSVNAPPKTNLASEHTEKVQTHLNDLERIANFSETNHHQSVRSDWTNLACAEIAEGDWRKGIEHAQHVIALFSGQCAKYHSNVLGDGADIPALLVRAKHAEEAEKLLLAAVARAQTIAGAKSLQVQGQLKDLFVFYVAQKDYANADTILDKVLACDLTTGETLSQSLSHSHCGQSPPQSADAVEVLWKVFEVLDRAKKNDPVFVKQSFEKILAAQKKVLAQTDERIMPTLTSLGDINFEMQRYDVADGYYSQAFAISKQYHKGEFAVRQVGKHFIENLKKLGRDDEAESLTDARWEGVWKK